MHILVVDDDDNLRETLALIVEYYGGSATPVGSPREARFALAERQPDVILCDISMPGEDGCQFIERIRYEEAASGCLSRVPAAAITAVVHERERILAAGFQQVLKKPFEMAEIPKLVRALLRPDLARDCIAE